MWKGDYSYLLSNLVMKDFRVRYRNMSLGVLWSLLNPLVMMGVMTFVFTQFFHNPNIRGPFPIFVLCGLVPYNFFSLAWNTATVSLVDNVALIKRVPMPRAVLPLAVVLANCVHLLVQIALLLGLVLVIGNGINRYWLWLLPVWGLEIVFVCGMGLISSALDVYIRDMRYVVESANTLLFWMVPIFYPFESIPPRFQEIYSLNPVAALVMAMRNILIEGHAPAAHLLWRLLGCSFAILGIGWLVFSKLQRRFYDYL